MSQTEPLEIARRAPSSASASDSSGPAFARFDPETRREAERSLSVAALTYAVVYFLAYTTGWLLDPGPGPSPFPPLHSLVVAGLSILGAVVVGFKARKGMLPPVSFEPLAGAFGVLGSLGIAAGSHEWRAFIEADPRIAGISWIGVWVIAYPNLVTLCPMTVLRVGLLSALCMPVMYAIAVPFEGLPVVDGRPSAGAAITFLAQLTFPILLCAGMSTFMAIRIFRMAHDVSRARRLGNYHLVELLGRGGMGEVWRATHRLLARPAAVKVIRSNGAGGGSSGSGTPGSTMLKRFEREAKATASLTSPHTVALYDFGLAQDGAFYYVMELLEGMDLRTLVERTGPVPSARVVHFLRQACASLADAHQCGLIHRDVKPANLYLCRRGLQYDFVKVLDFGLVKGAPEGMDTGQLTMEGTTSGTPAFMAPEMSLATGPIDARVDLYALGCVAYWLLTGRLVFEGPNALAILVQHAKEEPVPPSKVVELPVNPDLDALVMQLLRKDPAQRPPDAVELDRRLAAIEAKHGAWTQEQAERWWRAHLPHLAGAGALRTERPLAAAAP